MGQPVGAGVQGRVTWARILGNASAGVQVTTACTGDLRCAVSLRSSASSARNAGAVMRTLVGLEKREVDLGIHPHPRTMGRRRALIVAASTSLPSPLLLCAAFAVAKGRPPRALPRL